MLVYVPGKDVCPMAGAEKAAIALTNPAILLSESVLLSDVLMVSMWLAELVNQLFMVT